HGLSEKLIRIAADLQHGAMTVQLVPILAPDVQSDFGGANVVHAEAFIEQTHEWSERARSVVVFRFSEQECRTPFEVPQVHVVRETCSDRLTRLVSQERDLRLGIAPGR